MADRVGQQLGNYRLLRKIGQGAFAEVYLGEHQYLERLAAIKVLRVQLDPKTQEQFRREARTIAQLQHPHIVQVLDFGLDDHTPYLVMEYTPGGTLQSHYPKGTPLPVERIVPYMKQIASALDYAHRQRVIHRDIKPDNLLLNANHEVVLTDFGLAVVQGSLDSFSLSKPAAGTPLYMAPEQIQQHPCAASDQYALGVMVYQWLCGVQPFQGPGAAVFGQHLYQPPLSLCERLPDLPVTVEEAVFKALAKVPEHRFVCVTDFASAFEQACSTTQPLTWHGLAQQQGQEQATSQNTWGVPASPAEQANGSFSTQPEPMTVPRTEHRQEAGALSAPGPVLPPQPVSKGIKPSLAQSNRQRFLRRVRALWIEGVLEHSLHGAVLLALGLEEQRDALANLWHLVLQHPETAPRAFPAGTRITEVYEVANGELLILGAPGSGKTTLLLELARDLLDCAEQDEQQLMPVVFNLSSWATKPQPLSEWMIEELISKYQVPRKLARSWVETEQILPLLDGLDEVAPHHRTACITTINAYRQEHGLLPLVVVSRRADYLEQTGRLQLSRAVTIQPLTPHQVEDSLAREGESLRALRVALHQDAALRELIETPLMLSLLTLTYHEMSVEDLLRGGVTPTRQQVFERYVERMLRRRGGHEGYRPEQTKPWLAWLARQMKRQNQTLFYIERMQPDWLAQAGWHQAYEVLAVRFPAVLIGMLLTVTVGMLLFGFQPTPPVEAVFADILVGGLLGGLMGGLLSGTSRTHQPAARSNITWRRRWLGLIPLDALSHGLLMALLIGLSVGLLGPQQGHVYAFADRLRTGLIYGMLFGLSSLLLSLLLKPGTRAVPQTTTTATPGHRVWQRRLSRERVRKILLLGGLLGLSGGLSHGLSIGLSATAGHRLFPILGSALISEWVNGLSHGLRAGLRFWLIASLLSVLLAGRRSFIQPAEILTWSWSKLWRSLLNARHLSQALLIGFLLGGSIGLSGTLHTVVSSRGPSLAPSVGLIIGLSDGLSIGLSYWLLLGIFQGVSSEMLPEESSAVPNEGIRRSARHSLLIGLLGAGTVGLIGLLSSRLTSLLSSAFGAGLSTELSINPSYGVIAGLAGGLLLGLLNGGWACLQHAVLRFLLWRGRAIPWNYPHFLDFCAERILLRKVGGGYIFLHRLLLDYFANLETEPGSDASAESRQERLPAETVPSVELTGADDFSDVPTAPLAPTPILSEVAHLLPCGHEWRPHARFCGVCGAPVPS